MFSWTHCTYVQASSTTKSYSQPRRICRLVTFLLNRSYPICITQPYILAAWKSGLVSLTRKPASNAGTRHISEHNEPSCSHYQAQFALLAVVCRNLISVYFHLEFCTEKLPVQSILLIAIVEHLMTQVFYVNTAPCLFACISWFPVAVRNYFQWCRWLLQPGCVKGRYHQRTLSINSPVRLNLGNEWFLF